jgi:hypothetical protein
VYSTIARTSWRRRNKKCLNCHARGSTIEVPLVEGIRALVLAVREQGGFQTSLLK